MTHSKNAKHPKHGILDLDGPCTYIFNVLGSYIEQNKGVSLALKKLLFVAEMLLVGGKRE